MAFTKKRTPAQILRDLIHHYNLTGREAARRMHVDEHTIRRWISGGSLIPDLAQASMASLLGSPAWKHKDADGIPMSPAPKKRKVTTKPMPTKAIK